MQTDRRRFLRVSADFAVEVQRRSGEAPFAARTANISAGGAKLVSDAPVALRDELRLEIRFEGPRFLVFVDATVVRIERSDPNWVYGVEFHDLDRYIEQRIVRWVFSEDRRVAERRAAVRVPVYVLAWCRPEGGGERFRAGTVDIAGDGARIITPASCEVGDRIEIQFDVDEPAYHVEALAEIVWKQPVQDGRWTYGMRFEKVDRATQRRIVEHALHATGIRRTPSGGSPDTAN
ncbi:MAG TPA: PilZ domain-containing protein [Gaiellales bacterium]